MSNELDRALQEVGDKSQDIYGRLGLWPGRVEDVDDPRRLGRVRVRVFHLNGDKRSTPTSGLPWCKVLTMGGGGLDYGSGGREYPAGATVMVAFEQGDERSPIVVGGVHGSPLRDDKNPVEYLTVDGRSQSEVEQPWLPAEGNEVPQDIFGDSADGDTHPTRTVWKKSYKGHTIMCEDRDGFEFLKIIDRAGQVIELNSPVTVENNANNAQQRGNRNASDDTQIPQSTLVNQRGFIRLKDVGGNEILLDGSGNNEKIILRSRNRQGSSRQTITISSAKGREKIEITDKQGNRVTIDPNSAKESIALVDYAGNKVTFNAEDGRLEFNALTKEMHTTGGYEADYDQDMIHTVGGNDEKTVLGNKFLDVMNDLTASINGMTSAVFGGAVQASIANSPASGTPADSALSVEMALGGVLINTQVNATPMQISTLAGDLQFSTLAGNVQMSTELGNVNITTLGGNVDVTTDLGNLTLKTSVGDANVGTDVGSTTIHGSLGISLGAVTIFNLCRAEPTAIALNLIANTGNTDIRLLFGVIPIPPQTWPGIVQPIAQLTNPAIPASIHSQVGPVRNTTI